MEAEAEAEAEIGKHSFPLMNLPIEPGRHKSYTKGLLIQRADESEPFSPPHVAEIIKFTIITIRAPRTPHDTRVSSHQIGFLLDSIKYPHARRLNLIDNFAERARMLNINFGSMEKHGTRLGHVCGGHCTLKL
jgi:hypothetical protein